jgi:hypothetical protein
MERLDYRRSDYRRSFGTTRRLALLVFGELTEQVSAGP